jgi:hypothetical protein
MEARRRVVESSCRWEEGPKLDLKPWDWTVARGVCNLSRALTIKVLLGVRLPMLWPRRQLKPAPAMSAFGF